MAVRAVRPDQAKSFGPSTANPFEAPAVAGATYITEYAEIAEVLLSKSFAQGGYASSRQSLARDTVGVLEGAAHLQRRRLMARLFSEEAIATYQEQHLYPVIEHSLAEVASSRNATGVVTADLVPLTQRCLYRVAAALTGIDGLDDPRAVDRFIEQIRAITDGFMVDWLRQDPAVVMQRGADATEAFRREFFEPSAARRRELLAAGGPLPTDLVTLMYSSWDDSWDEEQPLREASLFLLASTQTTAVSLVLYVLRLEGWFEEHPEERALVADDSGFLRRAAFESLRLTVASPARLRVATADVRLGSGREIKAGERVALWFIPAHMEPRFGDDTAAFDPHRVVEEGAPWGLAFGAGVHACVGRPLVTGIKSKSEADGTMVSVARRFYAAGMRLDGDAVPDEGTFYDQYVSVPIRFTSL
jgi:cytochrome P450